ncbi:hypothetical protein EYF80_031783 [Liparis tanakae]|uniref:Uncharacterized protein n=1 Tax=Liparis tanakae TaxID=230148 RepID=A0A4Z2GWZ0_9TELE|nr:hypothetical protein EYF80_031783 [Liparis tanakae]
MAPRPRAAITLDNTLTTAAKEQRDETQEDHHGTHEEDLSRVSRLHFGPISAAQRTERPSIKEQTRRPRLPETPGLLAALKLEGYRGLEARRHERAGRADASDTARANSIAHSIAHSPTHAATRHWESNLNFQIKKTFLSLQLTRATAPHSPKREQKRRGERKWERYRHQTNRQVLCKVVLGPSLHALSPLINQQKPGAAERQQLVTHQVRSRQKLEHLTEMKGALIEEITSSSPLLPVPLDEFITFEATPGAAVKFPSARHKQRDSAVTSQLHSSRANPHEKGDTPPPNHCSTESTELTPENTVDALSQCISSMPWSLAVFCCERYPEAALLCSSRVTITAVLTPAARYILSSTRPDNWQSLTQLLCGG